MEKVLLISLKLNFTLNTLGCMGEMGKHVNSHFVNILGHSLWYHSLWNPCYRLLVRGLMVAIGLTSELVWDAFTM